MRFSFFFGVQSVSILDVVLSPSVCLLCPTAICCFLIIFIFLPNDYLIVPAGLSLAPPWATCSHLLSLSVFSLCFCSSVSCVLFFYPFFPCAVGRLIYYTFDLLHVPFLPSIFHFVLSFVFVFYLLCSPVLTKNR